MQEQVAFLKSRVPEGLIEKKVGFLAGGALTSVFSGQEINDLDIYLKDKTALKDAITELMADEWWMNFGSRKSLTFVKGEEKLQLIHYKYFNSPDDIYVDFDFSINMAAMDLSSGEISMADDFLLTLANRRPRINEKTAYPLCSIMRMNKYRDRGFSFPISERLKLIFSATKLNISSWEEFEDQAGGVYGELCLKDDPGKEFDLEYAISNIHNLFEVKREHVGVGRKPMKEEDFKRITGIEDEKFLGEFRWVLFEE